LQEQSLPVLRGTGTSMCNGREQPVISHEMGTRSRHQSGEGQAMKSSGSNNLQSRLLEDVGIATIAGTSFGAYGEGYLRFSYANSVDNIRRALERMAEFLSTAKAAD